MPRIKRWFPVTQDINADPELWELRESYGDRAVLVWLEILSIADRNLGLVGPDSDQTRNQLASKCRTNRAKVGLILGWCRVRGWLASENGLRVVKYAEYHKTREPNRIPRRETTASLPSEPSEPILLKSKRATQFPEDFEVSEEIQAWANKHQLPDPSSELEAFRDYHISKASTFKDWNAAFRTWLRNGKRFAGNGRPAPTLTTSQVPAYKPRPTERRADPEVRDGLRKLVSDLTEKMEGKV